MDEEKWRELIKVASIVAEEVIEKKLDSALDKDEIDAMIKERVSDFEKVRKKVQRLSKEIEDYGEPRLEACEELREFFVNSPEKNQHIFFFLAISSIDTEVLKKFLKRIGIMVERSSEDPSFETIVIIVPDRLQQERIFDGKIFKYIKKGEDVFDFNSSLFERLTESWMHSRNIAGSDEPLGFESLESPGSKGGGAKDV